MSTHASYYQDSLYPLQDRCLAVLAALGTPFYLTGGTALSREYLQHRYSDDLGFFAFDEIRWIEVPDLAVCERDLQRIAEDLAFGRKNGLVHWRVIRPDDRETE
ncbi:MAG: nucleotidyl transferase AbiEii/AbiGii toxin family protein [Bacteroidetes bacterium]|nr:nucleotidyl transferase AbiEii/AbiGii toxin family protein [Bacteroidota bacterium]